MMSSHDPGLHVFLGRIEMQARARARWRVGERSPTGGERLPAALRRIARPMAAARAPEADPYEDWHPPVIPEHGMGG